MTPMETDLLLDSLGSGSPFLDSTDWTAHRLLQWRDALQARPMPEWVRA